MQFQLLFSNTFSKQSNVQTVKQLFYLKYQETSNINLRIYWRNNILIRDVNSNTLMKMIMGRKYRNLKNNLKGELSNANQLITSFSNKNSLCFFQRYISPWKATEASWKVTDLLSTHHLSAQL